MHMYTLSLLAAAFVLGSAAAVPPAAAAEMSAKEFVRTASAANAFEIQSSKLALEKSQNKQIKRFAQKMIDDHGKTGDKLHAALRTAGLDTSLASDKLGDKQQAAFDKLEAASGDDFNRQYVTAQTGAHKDAVKLFGNYASRGDNAQLKQFAAETLPALKDHLQHVERLKP